MLLSAVSVLVDGQSSSEIPEGIMNNPVYYGDPLSVIVLIMLASTRDKSDGCT